MVKPPYPWPKPLHVMKRYCIREERFNDGEFFEKMCIESKLVLPQYETSSTWMFYYPDGTVESVSNKRVKKCINIKQ